ncbi:MAG: SRPBCC family protein [Pyrinomonadaceae bacterium]
MSLNSELLSNNTSSSVNVGGIERVACAITGGALAAYGLRRRSATGLVLTLAGAALLHRGGTGHCNTYQALGISTADSSGQKASDRSPTEHEAGIARDVHVEKSIVIDKSPEELYNFWRDFENLPRFMDHLESVNSVGFNRWHWVVKGPVGTRAEWDAEIYNEKPNELIAWRSLDGTVTNAGSVRFEPAPGEPGTQVKVVLNYNAPGGKVSALVAKLFGQEPGQMIEGDLRRLKQLFEIGEIAGVKNQPSGRHAVKASTDNVSSSDSASTTMTPASDLEEGRAASSGR